MSMHKLVETRRHVNVPTPFLGFLFTFMYANFQLLVPPVSVSHDFSSSWKVCPLSLPFQKGQPWSDGAITKSVVCKKCTKILSTLSYKTTKPVRTVSPKFHFRTISAQQLSLAIEYHTIFLAELITARRYSSTAYIFLLRTSSKLYNLAVMEPFLEKIHFLV